MRVAVLALSLLALASGALLRPRHHIQPSTRRTSSVLTAAVDVCDDQGETALVRAAEAGEEDQVRSLLASGADATLASFSGWTAVHGAAECGSVAVLSMLAEAGADLSARASSGKTPLDIARQYKQPAAASLLLEQGALANLSLPPASARAAPPLMLAAGKVRVRVRVRVRVWARVRVTVGVRGYSSEPEPEPEPLP